MPEGMTRVSVSEVRTAVPTSPGVEAGMVTLREDEPPHRTVPIVIGQPEARAIQSAWSGTVPRRPSTWDLFVSAVAILDGRLDRVVVTAVEEGRHFYANVELEREGERRVLAARPSDAIALALRAYGAEIYVADQVLKDLGLGEAPVDN
ncbi:MAG TPA: bifunctional nuclease family protein [Acidimicrobiales bacterium]|nr:bifunctional nuclease family protein [Acidimicrobiales bacterium]